MAVFHGRRRFEKAIGLVGRDKDTGAQSQQTTYPVAHGSFIGAWAVIGTLGSPCHVSGLYRSSEQALGTGKPS